MSKPSKKWMLETTYKAAGYLSQKEIVCDDWAFRRWKRFLRENYTVGETPDEFVGRIKKPVS